MEQTIALCGDAHLHGSFLQDLSEYRLEKCYYVEGPLLDNAIRMFSNEVLTYLVFLEREGKTVVEGLYIDDKRWEVTLERVQDDRQRLKMAESITAATRRRRPVYAKVWLLLAIRFLTLIGCRCSSSLKSLVLQAKSTQHAKLRHSLAVSRRKAQSSNNNSKAKLRAKPVRRTCSQDERRDCRTRPRAWVSA